MPDVVRIEYKENSSSYRVHPVYNESTAHIQKMVYEQRDKYQHQNEVNKIKIMTGANVGLDCEFAQATRKLILITSDRAKSEN
jgi:hypothetical protein